MEKYNKSEIVNNPPPIEAGACNCPVVRTPFGSYL